MTSQISVKKLLKYRWVHVFVVFSCMAYLFWCWWPHFHFLSVYALRWDIYLVESERSYRLDPKIWQDVHVLTLLISSNIWRRFDDCVILPLKGLVKLFKIPVVFTRWFKNMSVRQSSVLVALCPGQKGLVRNFCLMLGFKPALHALLVRKFQIKNRIWWSCIAMSTAV